MKRVRIVKPVRKTKPVTSRRFANRPLRVADDRGSASLWVVAGGVLVLLVALVAVLRGMAVLARERAEAAADLAALAAAEGIGVDGTSAGVCNRATVIATANQARVVGCTLRLGADGRTGTVDVTVAVRIRLAAVGVTSVQAHARAGRLAWAAPAGSARPVTSRGADDGSGPGPGNRGPARLAGVDAWPGEREGRSRDPLAGNRVWHDWSTAGLTPVGAPP